MDIKSYVISIPRLFHRLDGTFWTSWENSRLVNPELFIGVDGTESKTDPRWIKWNDLPYDCCMDEDGQHVVVWSLIQGYINLWQKIVYEKIETPILILEDDAVIVEEYELDFDVLFGTFLASMPNDWEIGYIGGRAHNMDKESRVNKHVWETMGTMKTTAIVYKDYNVCKKFLDSFVGMDEKRPIDVQFLRTIGRDGIKAYRSHRKLAYQYGYYSTTFKEGVNMMPAVLKDWNS